MTDFVVGHCSLINPYTVAITPQELFKHIKPPKKTKVVTECPYCEDWTTTELPIKSNADLSQTLALIARGDKKKEIVFHNNGVSYGIEIDFCPKCGRRLVEE